MRWLKTFLGVVLILAAGAAMYYWSNVNKEEVPIEAVSIIEELPVINQIVEEEPSISWKEVVLQSGRSFFPLDGDLIMFKSQFVDVGDWIGIYYKDKKGKTVKLGQYEVAYVDAQNLEILCDLDAYMGYEDKKNLILVIEEPIVDE